MAKKPEVDISFGFDAKNVDAQRVAEQRAGLLVKQVANTTQVGIRAIVVQSIRDGIAPYDAARLIRGLVGLTKQQALSVYNFRKELINSGLDIARVNKRVDVKAAKLLRERSLTIARTEIIGSLAEGSERSWVQAQGDGLLGATAKKEWITTPFDACKICKPLDGQTVPLKQPFQSIKGPIMRPTAHPRCRCAIAPVPGLAGSSTLAPPPSLLPVSASPISMSVNPIFQGASKANTWLNTTFKSIDEEVPWSKALLPNNGAMMKTSFPTGPDIPLISLKDVRIVSKTVDISKLRSSQPVVFPKAVKANVNKHSQMRIRVIRDKNGDYTIHDGHHRAEAQRLIGKKTIEVEVMEF